MTRRVAPSDSLCLTYAALRHALDGNPADVRWLAPRIGAYQDPRRQHMPRDRPHELTATRAAGNLGTVSQREQMEDVVVIAT
jgi:hypothetical protein